MPSVCDAVTLDGKLFRQAFCGCVYITRNAEYTHLVYLVLMLFVFLWCSFAVNLLVVTLQKKLSSGSHEIPYNKSDCWRYTHVTTLEGRTSLFLPGVHAENPSYATANGWLADLAAGLRLTAAYDCVGLYQTA